MNTYMQAQVNVTKRIAEKAVQQSDQQEGGAAFGHYFLHATITAFCKNGRPRRYACCISSGCSANPQAAVEAVNALLNVSNAYYNLD